MAKTYYGYKRREGLQAIDYLGAAKDLTEGLTGIFEEREKEREAIEEEVRKAEEEAKDVPMGDSSTLNEMVLDSSNGAAEALRIQAQLMRNGIIRPSEYTKFKQNTLDGVKDLKEGAASLNKNIADAKAAIDAGTASVSTMTFMEDAMKNTWFDRTRMYTDPKTGHLMIVRTDEKGKDIDGSETTMRNFKNQTKQIIDRYDVEKETSSFTKTLGEDIRLALKDPNIKTIKDALQKTTIDPETGEEYTNFQLIDQWVESITDADAASILVDELGGKYSATGDVNEKGKAGKVYYKIDPTAANKNTRTADLTDEQREAAKEYLKRNIYAQLDYVETPAPTTSGGDTDAQRKAQTRKESLIQDVNRMRELFEGNSALKNQVLSTYSEGLKERYNDFSSATIDGDELVIVYKDDKGYKKTDRHPLPNDFTEFVKTIGPILTGDKSLLEVLQDAEKPSGGRKKEKGAFEVEEEQYFGQPSLDAKTRQTFMDGVNVAVNSVPKGWHTRESTTFTEYGNKLRGALSGVKGLTIDVDGNGVLTMSVENLGTYPPIQLDEKGETMETVKSAVKTMLERVELGEMLDGSGMPDGSNKKKLP